VLGKKKKKRKRKKRGSLWFKLIKASQWGREKEQGVKDEKA